MEEPFVLHLGDSRDVLKTLADNSVDSVVTDPPYSLVSIVKRFGSAGAAPVKDGIYARASAGFMGQTWDTGETAFDPEFWREVWRVLKPGGHLLAFSGTRTYHRMTVAIEDAGFEIRDQIGWAYGSGFPKSHDVSKDLDRRAGATREVVGSYVPPNGKEWNLKKDTARSEVGATGHSSRSESLSITAPATDEAKRWQGWGTALKPAWEPICVARKPLVGSVAENVLAYGTGALNIDACRVETDDSLNGGAYAKDGGRTESQSLKAGSGMNQPGKTTGREFVQPQGRWPANMIHDGSDEVVALFPADAGAAAPVLGSEPSAVTDHIYKDRARVPGAFHNDAGSAARFFYCAKTSRADRDEGLEDFDCSDKRLTPMAGRGQGGLKCAKCQKWKASGNPCQCQEPQFEQQPFNSPENKNVHPTVKPTELMRYLCRLVTPPGGVVLDPFMGSGSTGKAAMMEGFRFIGVEREAPYLEIARRRVEFGRRAALMPKSARRKVKPKPVPAGQSDLFAAE